MNTKKILISLILAALVAAPVTVSAGDALGTVDSSSSGWGWKVWGIGAVVLAAGLYWRYTHQKAIKAKPIALTTPQPTEVEPEITSVDVPVPQATPVPVKKDRKRRAGVKSDPVKPSAPGSSEKTSAPTSPAKPAASALATATSVPSPAPAVTSKPSAAEPKTASASVNTFQGRLEKAREAAAENQADKQQVLVLNQVREEALAIKALKLGTPKNIRFAKLLQQIAKNLELCRQTLVGQWLIEICDSYGDTKESKKQKVNELIKAVCAGDVAATAKALREVNAALGLRKA